MKRVADEQDAVLGITPVVEPVVVEDALTVVAPQHRDVPVVVVHCGRAACPYQEPSRSPPIE